MSDDARQRVPVPADVELPDKLVAGLTGRQVVITAIAVLVIWAGFEATRTCCRCRCSRSWPPRSR